MRFQTLHAEAAMNVSTSNIRKSLDRETVRSITKLVLLALWLVVALYLLTLLPGADRLVPQTPVTVDALVSALASIVVVGLLLSLAPKLGSFVRTGIEGPKVLVADIASVVYWLVVLAAVLVAHRGLAGVVTPSLDGMVWMYDGVFFLLALPAILIIGARLYATLDPGSAFVADKLLGQDQDSGPEQNEWYDTS